MPVSMKEAALGYAGRGWPVFPCNAAKEPLVEHGVHAATTDPARIEEWWGKFPLANIGLDVGGAKMMVLDFDPGSDVDETDRLTGGLPDTLLTSQTPRGGEHWFYALADDEIVPPSASKIAPHVDIRSHASYVLLPPSRTGDGVYEWTSEGKPAFRTDEMKRLACSAREKHRDRDQWIIDADLPENIEAAKVWLRRDAKIAVQGQGGDHTAYATAAMMKSFGLSDAMAFDLIWEHWNPRCLPPWSADEIEHLQQKVDNGYAYNTSPPGNMTAAYKVAKTATMFKPVAADLPSGNEVTSGRFRAVDRQGMEFIRPPTWLIEDFLPSGAYAMLFGAPGTFKTFVALDIALSVATGSMMLEPSRTWRKVAKPGPVLFAAGEGRSQITKRVKAWERAHWFGNTVDNLVLIDPVPLITEELDPFIAAAKALRETYPLVVIDTVARSMQGVNENAQEHASKFTQLVERLQREFAATVLCLHHTGHDQQQRARGSSSFVGDVDTLIRLDRQGKDMVVALTMVKQKDAPEWTKAKLVKLAEVQVGGDTTLTVVEPGKGEAPTTRSKNDPTRADETVLEVIEEVLIALLKCNPLRVYSQIELARAIAVDDRLDVSSKTLSNNHLTILRESKDHEARRCYDPDTKKWQYRA